MRDSQRFALQIGMRAKGEHHQRGKVMALSVR